MNAFSTESYYTAMEHLLNVYDLCSRKLEFNATTVQGYWTISNRNVYVGS